MSSMIQTADNTANKQKLEIMVIILNSIDKELCDVSVALSAKRS